MNIGNFEEKNLFQLIRNRIIRLSNGSIIKQDLLSTLLLVYVIANVIGTMKFMWNGGLDKVFECFISSLLSLILNFNLCWDFCLGKVDKFIIVPPTFSLSYSDLLSSFALLTSKIILLIISWFSVFKIFVQEKFINEVIKWGLLIIVTIIIFGEYRFTLSLVMVFILASLIQFGKGRLFRLLNICLLFLTPSLEYPENVKSVKTANAVKIFLWLVSCLSISKIISIWFKIPIEVAVLLVIVLMVRFCLQLQTNNPRLEIVSKGAIYFIVFLTVVTTNNTTNEMISLVTVSIAIYFAVDRFFSLFKEIEILIQNDEINYYLYFENSIDILKQKFLPDEFLTSVINDIDDQKLYGQLIIRVELGMKDSFEKVLSLVKEQREYKSYQLLLLSMEYKLQKKYNKELTIVNFIEGNLHNKILYDEQMILPIEFLVLYGEELKELGDYEQAKDYLSFSEYYDSYSYIKSYFDCIKVIGDKKKLKYLQKKYILHLD